MTLDPSNIEKMGRKDFSPYEFLDVRQRGWALLREMVGEIRPGMTEPDAQAILKEILQRHGAEKSWHKPVIRFGKDTLKTFSPASDPTIRLAENDIFFLDFGPVWNGYEADIGETFVLGDDPDMKKCAIESRVLFDLVRDQWRDSGMSGAELYDFAEKAAQSRGWLLVRDVDGHRLGDFPHHAHFRGGLGELDFRPREDAWVLEIQIRHPSLPFGAFYEDLLTAD